MPGLPLTADVEQAGVEGHRHRQTGEDETGGVVEGEAYPLAGAEGAVPHDFGCPDGADVEVIEQDGRHQEGQQDIDCGQHAHGYPGRNTCLAHEWASLISSGTGVLDHHQAESVTSGCDLHDVAPCDWLAATSSGTMFAIIRPMVRSSALAPSSSPTMRPSAMTRMRSEGS